jgi:hypothetical protein
MTQYRAVCPCGVESDPVPSKSAIYRWASDHNDTHDEAGEDRCAIVVEEVVLP